MSTQIANVSIRTTRPYWMHKRPPSMFETERQAKPRGKAGNSPDEWKETFYATQDGELFVPPEAVFTCLRDAGRFSKRGRAQLTTYVASTLQVLDDKVLTGRKMPKGTPPVNQTDLPVYLDVRAVKNPNSRGSTNIRYRVAMSPGVTLKFKVAFEETVLSKHELEQVIRDAGMLVGLGDGRSIGMGRFELQSFELNGHE